MRFLAILFAATCLLSGCATWTFVPQRTSNFINEYGEVITVDYGIDEKEHVSKFITPTGSQMDFKTKLKIRVTLTDGTRFVAYRVMSPGGLLYKTDDDEWEYYEEMGTNCIVAENDGMGRYDVRFRGILCRSKMSEAEKAKPKPISASTPYGFGKESSGPAASNGPRDSN